MIKAPSISLKLRNKTNILKMNSIMSCLHDTCYFTLRHDLVILSNCFNEVPTMNRMQQYFWLKDSMVEEVYMPQFKEIVFEISEIKDVSKDIKLGLIHPKQLVFKIDLTNKTIEIVISGQKFPSHLSAWYHIRIINIEQKQQAGNEGKLGTQDKALKGALKLSQQHLFHKINDIEEFGKIKLFNIIPSDLERLIRPVGKYSMSNRTMHIALKKDGAYAFKIDNGPYTTDLTRLGFNSPYNIEALLQITQKEIAIMFPISFLRSVLSACNPQAGIPIAFNAVEVSVEGTLYIDILVDVSDNFSKYFNKVRCDFALLAEDSLEDWLEPLRGKAEMPRLNKIFLARAQSGLNQSLAFG